MLKHVLDIIELLDRPQTSGALLADHLRAVQTAAGADPATAPRVEVRTVEGDKGSTDFVSVTVPGRRGKLGGGDAPTLGVLGRLGGVGARPERIGLVSDADGAVAALSAAAKLLDMYARGDVLDGDVTFSTHVSGWAPTQPHDPVPFMDSPVDTLVCNREEISPAMDAVVSIDTTKGNRLLNHRGVALSPTVCQGWILRVSEDLVSVLESVTGEPARILPITTQDITPYGNGVHHLNSILQPAVATTAPVVGLAITAAAAVAGCATGASHETDIAVAARFAIETAKEFGRGTARFLDPEEFARLVELYGPMTHLQALTPAG
ncbi:DUF1177 domain-containing protein [Streptomyces hygroscopicus]|uniref:DUF1177 domain-containing protein n=1 Tax=Streptomyces hygroscopicus TaxID=1912 RepID=UPI0008377AC9|nr:DUF1177 domain-containing protein [Streptomyces hygroscopicus]GLV77484.1 hypothetical protein Shyhy02_54840 [Streptomyces hygroscopicus subsp. hygroscopicus]